MPHSRQPPLADSPVRRAPDVAAVRPLVEPVVAAHGLELVDLEWASGRQGLVLRVIIDHPEPPPAEQAEPAAALASGGVTLDDCVRVSRDLSTALDVEDPVNHSYSLEVSSPGIDRPLESARDFRRQVGRLAKVKLHTPAPDGQHVLRGTLLAADDQGFEINVDGNHHRVELDNVREARLVFELGGSRPADARGRRGAPRRGSKGHSRPNKRKSKGGAKQRGR